MCIYICTHRRVCYWLHSDCVPLRRDDGSEFTDPPDTTMDEDKTVFSAPKIPTLDFEKPKIPTLPPEVKDHRSQVLQVMCLPVLHRSGGGSRQRFFGAPTAEERIQGSKSRIQARRECHFLRLSSAKRAVRSLGHSGCTNRFFQ